MGSFHWSPWKHYGNTVCHRPTQSFVQNVPQNVRGNMAAWRLQLFAQREWSNELSSFSIEISGSFHRCAIFICCDHFLAIILNNSCTNYQFSIVLFVVENNHNHFANLFHLWTKKNAPLFSNSAITTCYLINAVFARSLPNQPLKINSMPLPDFAAVRLALI